MVHTIALGPNQTDTIRMARSKFIFRTYDITAYTNRVSITSNITFVDGGGGSDTITRDAGSFVTDGFQGTGTIIITGTVSNNATYTITAVAALTVTFATGTVTAEGPIATAVTFTAGTGLNNGRGEIIALAELGLSVIDGYFVVPTELNTHMLRWNRTTNGLVMLDEAFDEVINATNGGTFQLLIVGY